jgi:quinohemoprotein amine dehydrogenase beta subunit
VLFCALTLAAGAASAKDYLLAGIKPDKLVLVDPGARKVAQTFTIRDAAPGVGIITPAPDGKTAYAVVNRWESVAGIDLDSGKEVFRADLSAPPERVKAIAMDVSPDGKELFVYEVAAELGSDEYHAKDTRIAVYRTSDGTAAKPVRTFPAPRRTMLIALSTDGSKLYALSWDVVVLDPKTGKEIGREPVRKRVREGFGEPDVIDMWPQYETSGILITPYSIMRTNVPPTDPSAAQTGLMTLDLATGELQMKEFENFTKVIFSGVVNPVRRDEVYMVYATLTKLDRRTNRVVKRIDTDHTYYSMNIASDGHEIYLGGGMSDIGVYSTDSLKRLAVIPLPGGADQGVASLRLVRR